MDVILQNKHVKRMLPLAVAITLVGCGSSSNDEPVVQDDTTTGGDIAPGTDVAPDTDTTPIESALDTASRIELPRYERLIENVSAVENAGEFAADNYALAIVAVAESSETHVVFDQLDFLSLLERQVMSGNSPLDMADANEADPDTFNRAHSCPGGGRLLARKFEPTQASDIPGVVNVDGRELVDISGEFRFSDCLIGEILIDGSYDARYSLLDSGLRADLFFNGLSIIGVDGASTTLSNSFSHTMQITDDGINGATFNSETNMNTTASVAVPDQGVVTMEMSVQSTESAAAEGALPTDIIPPETYNVRIQNAVISVEGDTRLELIANTVANATDDSVHLNRAPLESTFGEGEIQYLFSPRSNSMTLNAGNGDPTSFDVFIEQADGSVVSFVAPWDSGDYGFGSLGQRMLQSWPQATE